MAMCGSGSLGICTAPQGGCSSISTAVGTGSGSLAALSASAGKGAPHSMLEFYGYSSASLSVSPGNATFPYLGGTCIINVTANAGNAWQAYESESFITLLASSGNGNGQICIRSLKNASGSACFGTVCVVSSAPTQYIYVESQSEWID